MTKILCLPGFLQSGAVFAEKSSGLRKLLTKKLRYDLDYIDPPVVISSKEQLPFKLSEDPLEESEKWARILEKGLNRCWWLHTSDGEYEGFDEAMKFVTAYIRQNGPYDGIIGFSQGAAMAAVIANSIEKSVPQNGPLAIAVMFSPFAFTVPRKSRDVMARLNSEVTDVREYANLVSLNPLYREYFTQQLSGTKTVAVYGMVDTVVPPVRTEYLCSLYAQIDIMKHDGGHYMPNKKLFLDPIVELFKKACESTPAL
ncbi:FSH1-domain-containing protein [Metschnikowia bicuspidata var. bicuspidata NRRL YB-4993]|uniref:FSH1-domain-containing protein n=1 Tax=Metschnikowia bicuspidata var. bicuspidata NRRL YB-4993 TaxID=869754 RepID=A0A1A0HCZ2_9ASCO|nr:FSH1-domain-containing protein [Metschnikowia bicuspidata var. bicuspidata NRRL YB-4993]OBA21845.1 FSH1-domain-containing protein [Metschnikowia bicuspidata var. bicuspidata NRRL YB-4993]